MRSHSASSPQAVGSSRAHLLGIGLSQRISSSTGQRLDENTREAMEAKFGHDFGNVRLHTDGLSAEGAQSLGARALTQGRDIFFGSGQFRPGTHEGDRLIAHELTHVVQQNGGSPQVQQHMPRGTVAGKWIIRDRPTLKTAAKKAGVTKSEMREQDAKLMEQTFQEICNLAKLKKDGSKFELEMPTLGNSAADKKAGCGCLDAIEIDLIRKTDKKLSADPEISFVEHSWSHASVESNPPFIKLRYPGGIFQSGYWTDNQKRVTKDTWQLLAHEACGHFYNYVTTGDAAGRVDSETGHNQAIEGENRVAQDPAHAIPKDQLRGLDKDPASPHDPLPGHRGESFIQAVIPNFDYKSVTLPGNAADVIEETEKSVAKISKLGLTPRIQVEGFAYEDEGGYPFAFSRALETQVEIDSQLSSNAKITPLPDRFGPALAQINTGTAPVQAPDPLMKTHVYIYHRKHSGDTLSPEASKAMWNKFKGYFTP